MTSKSEPQPNHETPEGQIFALVLVNEAGAWKARVKWFLDPDQVTNEVKMDVAIAVDAVMRHHSEEYGKAMAYLDEVADLGFKVREAPPSLERVISRWIEPGGKHAAERRASGG